MRDLINCNLDLLEMVKNWKQYAGSEAKALTTRSSEHFFSLMEVQILYKTLSMVFFSFIHLDQIWAKSSEWLYVFRSTLSIFTHVSP